MTLNALVIVWQLQLAEHKPPVPIVQCTVLLAPNVTLK